MRAERRVHRLPDDVRIYAIGDIHGRADLLARMMAAIDADIACHAPKRTLQVFLGDYIDRGPASRPVIDLLIGRAKGHATVALKGNHESYALRFLTEPAVLEEWRQFGGLETLMSYGLRPSVDPNTMEQRKLSRSFAAALPPDHAEFLTRLSASFTCGDFFFVHAGVRPGAALDRQSEDDLLWIRDDFLLHEADFGKMVVHGHTPVLDADFRTNRINIDTGAFATGKLTCLIIEAEELFLLTLTPEAQSLPSRRQAGPANQMAQLARGAPVSQAS